MPKLKLNEIQGSNSFRRLNPALFGLDPTHASEPKPPAARPLVGRSPQHQAGQGSMAAGRIIVTMVAHRHRILDDDNLVGSLKPLRDAIAQWLGVDDGDPRLTWESHQIRTTGAEGVCVKVERQ
jgi:hypothetical protein